MHGRGRQATRRYPQPRKHIRGKFRSAVHPHRGKKVTTVTTDRVDDILLTEDQLLAQDPVVDEAGQITPVKRTVESSLHLVLRAANANAIRSETVRGLYHDGPASQPAGPVA